MLVGDRDDETLVVTVTTGPADPTAVERCADCGEDADRTVLVAGQEPTDAGVDRADGRGVELFGPEALAHALEHQGLVDLLPDAEA
jgi:hypothetical protein